MLPAIPTYYDGHHFRSRLEARWALFFNFIGIRWEFEREGFAVDIDGKRGGYLPDFWLPSLQTWFEAKPEWDALSSDDLIVLMRKALAVVSQTDGHIVIAFGALRDEVMVEMLNPEPHEHRDVHWGRCAECLAWDIGLFDQEDRPCGHDAPLIGREQTRGALLDAHAHRFWEPS